MTTRNNSPPKANFTHCALHVRDVEASIAFYRRYCGFEVLLSHGKDAERVVWIGQPDAPAQFVFVLVPGGEGQERPRGDMTHYGFAVSERDEIDRIAEMARQEGCLRWEPKEFKPPVGYLCGVEDPDGYVIEFSFGQPLGPGTSYHFESQETGS